MGNQELTLKGKKKLRSSKLQKQKKQNLQKLKTPKVRYDLTKEELSGFVFNKIIKTNIRLSKTNYLRASSYFNHDLGLRKSILNIKNNDQK